MTDASVHLTSSSNRRADEFSAPYARPVLIFFGNSQWTRGKEEINDLEATQEGYIDLAPS